MHFDDVVEGGPARFAMVPVEAKIDSSPRHEPHLNKTSEELITFLLEEN